jgi:hypothetical protein
MDQASQEYLDQRPRYWLCAFAFGFVGVAALLLSVHSGLMFAAYLQRDMTLLDLLGKPFWAYLVALPSLYAAVIGSYLLWGRWIDAGWQRRAGAFVLLSLINAVAGTILNADALGFELMPADERWSVGTVFQLFGWVKLWLAASLAAEVASHLGVSTARPLGYHAARLAIIGLLATAIGFVVLTEWQAGLPLRHIGAIRDLPTFLLSMAPHPVRCLCAGQVAVLCFLAARGCRGTWLEIGQWEATGTNWGGNWGERGD